MTDTPMPTDPTPTPTLQEREVRGQLKWIAGIAPDGDVTRLRPEARKTLTEAATALDAAQARIDRLEAALRNAQTYLDKGLSGMAYNIIRAALEDRHCNANCGKPLADCECYQSVMLQRAAALEDRP